MKKNNSGLIVFFIAFLFLNYAQAQTSYTVFETTEMKVDGTSTVSDWSVQINNIKGNLVLEEGNKKEEGAVFYTNLSFSFPVEEMESGRGPIMNSKIKTALKSEENPTVTFNSKKSKIVSITANEMEVEAIGILEVAGIKKELIVLLDCVIDSVTNEISFEGNKDITMSMFEIEKPTAFFGKLETMDELNVQFNLIFK